MEKERKVKHPSDSYTEQVHIITQSDINGFDRLFGGALMAWIDILAAVVARRHSERNVTTVFVDTLEFRAPARVNDTIYMTGKLTYAGKTSMEVCVKTFVEELSGDRKLINVAYLILVALASSPPKCRSSFPSPSPNLRNGKPAPAAVPSANSAAPRTIDRSHHLKHKKKEPKTNIY